MIHYAVGDLLTTPAEALVNPVNTQGVMGAGLAKAFKAAFPDASSLYQAAAKRGEVVTGRVLVTASCQASPKWIIHFPTKGHWQNPSRVEWIDAGLRDLVAVLQAYRIQSVALPLVGCGLGGLPVPSVLELIAERLDACEGVEVVIPAALWETVHFMRST